MNSGDSFKMQKKKEKKKKKKKKKKEEKNACRDLLLIGYFLVRI